MALSAHISAILILNLVLPVINGWGETGHFTVCKIAEGRLSEKANHAVRVLLHGGDLSNYCSWADHVKFRYHWSSPLHFIDTPDKLCNYDHRRDCKDEKGNKDICASGAIMNYTSQLLAHGRSRSAFQHSSKLQNYYNLTEALLFLSHFLGDIHQPLHVGYTSDKGGNTIDVYWYNRKNNLHHVWDDDILGTEERNAYNNLESFIGAIEDNITGVWSDEVAAWEKCSFDAITCPDIYATESITAACKWAYEGVHEGSFLGDAYLHSRSPVVNLRLAQAGVRLAATLNRIFRDLSFKEKEL